jgi:hypothetical protein
MSDRQKVFLAILASMLVHVGIALALISWPARSVSEMAKARPSDLSRLVVTIMPPRPADVNRHDIVSASRPTPPPRHFIPPVLDSDGLKTAQKAPEHALFQSDSNMVAASLLPPMGNIPLPTEAGPKRNFMEFENRPASMGKGQTPSETTRARRAAEASPAMPEQTPYAVTQVQHPPGQQSTPAPTPRPVPTPPPDSIALGKPTPTPAPPIHDLARLTLRGQADMAPLSQQPAPRAVPVHPVPPSPNMPEPSTQRETARTRIAGGIAVPGAPAVDAVETPFGRYHRKLSNLIGSRWQLYLQEHPKDVGDVTILVKLDTTGKVTATRVIANHSMDDLAELSTRAIMESDLPPVPDDLAPMLRDGKLDITFNFNVYDPGNDSSGR